MMEHPITPPLELYGQWYDESPDDDDLGLVEYVATQAARWGADQELEACVEWIGSEGLAGYTSRELRAARRPKPPSLKEQALQALYRFDDTEGHADLTLGQIEEDFVIIRRALESLPDQ